MSQNEIKRVKTEMLEIAYEEQGNPNGTPVILLHGFPDDTRSWDTVVSALVAANYRTFTPYLRGFGQTRFLDEATARSGQQSEVGQDVIDFANKLGLDKFILVGHDWGNLAAQVVAALYPERVIKLISVGRYGLYWTADQSVAPSYPGLKALWYIWFLNTSFASYTLEGDRRGFCRYLWETWSPTWKFSEEEYAVTAPSFDNPDFVTIVLNFYNVNGTNAPLAAPYAEMETKLATYPPTTVPSIVLQGADDGIDLLGEPAPAMEAYFTGGYKHELVKGAGHFIQREKPEAVINAIIKDF
jgi:pimeloyl-ACP methyl ester carboxylesterase